MLYFWNEHSRVLVARHARRNFSGKFKCDIANSNLHVHICRGSVHLREKSNFIICTLCMVKSWVLGIEFFFQFVHNWFQTDQISESNIMCRCFEKCWIEDFRHIERKKNKTAKFHFSWIVTAIDRYNHMVYPKENSLT